MLSLKPYPLIFFKYQFYMFRVFFTISAFYQHIVEICYCKIQVTQRGVHFFFAEIFLVRPLYEKGVN